MSNTLKQVLKWAPLVVTPFWIRRRDDQVCLQQFITSTDHHYTDVIMGAIASQITTLTIVYSTVYSDADQRKHQSSASLAFARGIHRSPVNFPHKRPVTRKMFPFDDDIMIKWSRNLKYMLGHSSLSVAPVIMMMKIGLLVDWLIDYLPESDRKYKLSMPSSMMTCHPCEVISALSRQPPRGPSRTCVGSRTSRWSWEHQQVTCWWSRWSRLSSGVGE